MVKNSVTYFMDGPYAVNLISVAAILSVVAHEVSHHSSLSNPVNKCSHYHVHKIPPHQSCTEITPLAQIPELLT